MPQTNKVNYNTSRTNRIEEVYTDIIMHKVQMIK